MPYTLHTYASVKAELESARKYLRKRSILSQIETIRAGHHRFITHWPGNTGEHVARKVLHDAFYHAGVSACEPWQRTDNDPTSEAIGVVVEQREAVPLSLNDKLTITQRYRKAFDKLANDSTLGTDDRRGFRKMELEMSMQAILALAEALK